jgi:hypothetical protein
MFVEKMRHSFLFDLRMEGLPLRIAHFPLIVRTDLVLNTVVNRVEPNER